MTILSGLGGNLENYQNTIITSKQLKSQKADVSEIQNFEMTASLGVAAETVTTGSLSDVVFHPRVETPPTPPKSACVCWLMRTLGLAWPSTNSPQPSGGVLMGDGPVCLSQPSPRAPATTRRLKSSTRHPGTFPAGPSKARDLLQKI